MSKNPKKIIIFNDFLSLFGLIFGFLRASIRLKKGPRWLQDGSSGHPEGPERAPRQPKMAQDGPKMAPRCP